MRERMMKSMIVCRSEDLKREAAACRVDGVSKLSFRG